MREAKNAAAVHAGPSLEQIHAAAALVAISGEVGVAEHAEDAEFRHLRCATEMGGLTRLYRGVADARAGAWDTAGTLEKDEREDGRGKALMR